ncbi:hypothetical protein Patl1_21335 [Pistacia atlantica]|uniref:Uncharacterized protein n=1 Tax=Pistacia atlantica TaxID=434234 RepID=A0ACC1BIV8_9ROSI|nr:hypothetical protein Patl1_21335 [Pistacia atlantica]
MEQMYKATSQGHCWIILNGYWDILLDLV